MKDNDIITNENLNEGKVAVTVYINPDETVGIEKRRAKKPNYFMIGNGTMNKHKIYGIDLLKELTECSKAGQFLILQIKDGINHINGYHHVVKVDRKELTSTECQYLAKGYKELVEKDLVRRVKRGHYMINPNALVPVDYEQALEDWNNC